MGGLSIASALLQSCLKKQLRISLEGRDGRERLIERELSGIEHVMGLAGRMEKIDTAAYAAC